MNPQSYGSDSGGGMQMRFAPITPVVKQLLILNVGVFLVTYMLSFSPALERIIMDVFALRPSDWFTAPMWFPFWQLLTSGFMHSLNDLWHLLGNMVMLYFFGSMLEGVLGGRRFLWVYMAALLTGSLAHLLLQPLIGFAGVNTVGASGAVLGVTIAMAVLRPHARVVCLFIPISLKWLVIALVALDVFGLLQELKGRPDSVAHWVHLGGAAFGFLAARKGWIWKDPITDWKVKQEQRQAATIENEDLKMDELLAKIHKEGMNSLSTRERAFLKKVSNRGQ